ncbi:MAG: hypothetical protein KJ645_06245 [Planctomycetes bacterium]|nr:hypothetical protein [Planctomycetota bacterium]
MDSRPFKVGYFTVSVITFFLLVITWLVCLMFIPYPWSAWRYEYDYAFHFPQPWYLPDMEKYDSLYVDGAFLCVRVMAHNETTNDGDPPYALIIPVYSTNPEVERIIFHAIEIQSSLDKKYVVSPISHNRNTEKTGDLEFPVDKWFEPPPPLEYPSEVKDYPGTTLCTDTNLEFDPDNGEVIKIILDMEVHRSDSSTRRKVKYEFHPHKESGFFRFPSV